MRHYKRFLILFPGIIFGLSFNATILNAEEVEVYKIGAILPLTGPGAVFGEEDKRGIILAVEDINSKGGINGKKIEVIFEDSKTDPKEAVTIFNKFLAFSIPPVILSELSSVGMALKPLIEENKIVMFIIAAHPDLTKEGGYVFRMLPTASNQTERLARLASEELKLKNIAILYINDDLGDALRKSFINSFKNLKGRIRAVEAFDKEGVDFRPQITKIIAKKPQAIFVAGYGKALGIVIKQIREMGYEGLLLGTPEIPFPEVLSIAGKAAEEAIIIDVLIDENNPKVKKFIEKFKRRFKKEPTLAAYLAYDMLQMVAVAIKKKGYTSEGIREGLLSIRRFPGLTGRLDVLSNGDVNFRLGLKVIKGGKAVPLVDVKKRVR